MKKMKICYVAILVLGTTITSCSKEESVPNNSVLMAASSNPLYRHAVLAAYSFGVAGIDPYEKLKLPMDSVDPSEGPKYPFEVIEVPTPTYKEETCLLNISKLETHKTYHAIQSNKLTVGFFDDKGSAARVLKLNSDSTGWNAAWGCVQNVEVKNPDVLYVSTNSSFITVIYLSKPCIEFGFELAPDLQDYDHNIGVKFGNSFNGTSEGCITSKVRSPSGARLFALKATKPFTTITVTLNDKPIENAPMTGFGIANIRYKLAE
ncbi:MAG: hypothetical protein JWQ28_6 [Pedobacter sp.]|nr:hypothetical protein [Pedobacter sp.]